MKHLLLAAVTLATLASARLNADELFPSLRAEPVRFGLGIGGVVEDEGYVGIGTESAVMPVFLVQYKRFRLFGPQMDFRLLGNEKTSIGLRADYRVDGYEAADGPIFAGMEERKAAASVGIAGRHSTRFGDFSFDFVRAVESERGARGGVYYAYPIKFEKLTVLPRIGLEYFDADLVNYYYGVRGEEATATRPFYVGDSTLNVDGGVDLHYNFDAHHSLLGSLKYRAFGTEIKNSPLIEDDGSPRVNLGYVYRF
jgi:outer membrane protein